MAKKKSTGKYAVPAEIRAMKPKGVSCSVKIIKGGYYVYEHKRVRDPETNKMKNASGKELGRIYPDRGFVPNDNKLALTDISIVDFGEYAIAVENSKDVLEKVKAFFNGNDALTAYAMGIIWFVNGYTYVEDYKALYDQSWLSVIYPDLALSEEASSRFLKNLGRRHQTVELFEQSLIDDGSGTIAIDGHVILSVSNDLDMASYGNKYRKINNTQQNFMTAFDVEQNHPLSVMGFDGGTLDKTAVKDLFKTYRFKNATFIVDMGFYSKENIKLFSSNGNKYVIPLPEIYKKIYKAMTDDLKFTGEFVYKKGKGKKCHASIISYRDEIIDGIRYILFRDEEMRNKQKAEYLEAIGIEEGFTQEEYDKKEALFGTILLQTNKTENPKDVYGTYKKRWKVETYYNHLKNGAKCKGTHKSDYYELQGEAFIMTIEGLIYSDFMKVVQNNENKKIRNKSENECIKTAAYQKLSKHADGIWYKNELRSNVSEFLKDLNVDVNAIKPNGMLA